MTIDDAIEAVEAAKHDARAAARRLYGSNMTGPTDPIVDRARLTVIETTLAALMAERSTYVEENFSVKTALELRDYCETVAEEIAK